VGKDEWVRIRITWDGYEGWCKQSQLGILTKKPFKKETKYFSASHTGKLQMPEGEMWMPMGCELIGLKGGKIKPGAEAGKFKGKKTNMLKAAPDGDTVIDAAMKYLHAPYQWGGRSIAGIDCSGLTQMAYKMGNKPIPRDASLQAQEGQLVDFLQNAQRGDLAFFDEKDGRITHVGILLDHQTIIHATSTTGRTVIDRIDQGGIISTILKRRTHNLRVVKRFV
jgi:cell wall-associated NlpC family hydrolase